MPLLRLARLVLDVAGFDHASRFWCAALGYVEAHRDETFAILKHPSDPRAFQLGLQPAEGPKRDVNPVHLELFTDDMRREAARLEGLGATRVPDWPYPEGEVNWIVMRDPDGHEFCVVEHPAEART